MADNFMAGAGRAVITPPIGAWMAGYAPARRAETIHDDLHVTAIAFAGGGQRALLMSADVCQIFEPHIGSFRRSIADATGVPFEQIVMSAIHTHSGPATFGTHGGAPADEAYLETIFRPQAVKAAQEAVAALRPAVMGVAETQSEVGINRREVREDGSVALGQNPWGLYDPIMTVVSFRDYSGAPIANLIHYGAHCTGSGAGPEVTRDWAGPMIDRLEEQSRGLTVYFNGAEGDVGPRLANGRTTGNLELALELGGIAAADAVRAWRSIREWNPNPVLRVLADQISLPCRPLDPLDILKARLAALGDPEKLVGLPVWEYETLGKRIAEKESGVPEQTAWTLDQTLIAVGSVVFVPFPFEIFSEITIRLRQFSPFAHTLSLSNANGVNFYFPSRSELCRGGYEVWLFRAFHVHALSDDADQAAFTGNLRLLRQLAESGL